MIILDRNNFLLIRKLDKHRARVIEDGNISLEDWLWRYHNVHYSADSSELIFDSEHDVTAFRLRFVRF